MLEQCQIIPVEAAPRARGCVPAPVRVRSTHLSVELLSLFVDEFIDIGATK